MFGFIQGIVCLAAAQTLTAPARGWQPAGWDPKAEAAKRGLRQSLRDVNPGQMVKTSHFWLLYLMFVMVAASGLMATAQVGPIAKFYGVNKIPMAFGMTALVMAVEFDRILNGLTRPFWGWVSDHIGRENTMAIAFTLQGVFVFLWMNLTTNPVAFVLLTGLVFFAWGEIFSLFPATLGDLFGTKYATTNYGVLYTAKGVASIFAGPLAAMLFTAMNSWSLIFTIAMTVNFITAALALWVLKPLTARYVRVVEAPKPSPIMGSSK
ncbi:MAG: MFS transporter [Dehalococcoidales bacterium]|nr:MFS transporter [Dehalococcoidales bacterium]